MRPYLSLAVVLIAGPALSASAQVTASMWWEVDAGSGWQGGDVTTSHNTVTVRRMAGWNAPFTTHFSWTLFDATIATPDGSTDMATNCQLNNWLLGPGTGTAIASRFGSVIKIDDSRDTAPPGAGTRWNSPYQSGSLSDPHRDNPIEIIRFTLNMDSSFKGLRTISQIQGLMSNVSGANTTNRSLLLFDTFTGPVIPEVTRLDARINYIPAPASASVLAAWCLYVTRRRRA